MIMRRDGREAKRAVNCHKGSSILWCAEMLCDYGKVGSGFACIHENHLEPGLTLPLAPRRSPMKQQAFISL